MTRALVVLLAAGSAISAAASAAELKVMMIGAINPGFSNIAEQYKRETGNAIVMLNDTAPGLARRIAGGETGDILIAPVATIDEVAKQSKVIAATRTPVARVGIGVAVRRGAAAPNVAGVDALKQALLNAESIIYNQGSSGLYIQMLFEQMGIAKQLEAKTVRFANAGQVVNRVMEGKGNEIGFAPLPEIMSSDQTKLQLVGPLPAAVQNYTAYEGVVMTGGTADAAKDFIRYLTMPAARKTFAAAGVE